MVAEPIDTRAERSSMAFAVGDIEQLACVAGD
jgi:hypothetical protein